MWSLIAVPAIDPILTDQPMGSLEMVVSLCLERRNSGSVYEGRPRPLRGSRMPILAL